MLRKLCQLDDDELFDDLADFVVKKIEEEERKGDLIKPTSKPDLNF